MTWKAGFVQFSCKPHCFSALKKISGQFHDFENFDLAKKCCAWPEKSVFYNLHGRRTVFLFWREFQARVTILKTFTLKNAIWPKRAAHDLKRAFLYNFHGKCTVFPFWREFQAKVTILRTLTLKNAIWPKSAAHDVKRAFCTIFMKSALFSRFQENFRPVWRF